MSINRTSSETSGAKRQSLQSSEWKAGTQQELRYKPVSGQTADDKPAATAEAALSSEKKKSNASVVVKEEVLSMGSGDQARRAAAVSHSDMQLKPADSTAAVSQVIYLFFIFCRA